LNKGQALVHQPLTIVNHMVLRYCTRVIVASNHLRTSQILEARPSTGGIFISILREGQHRGVNSPVRPVLLFCRGYVSIDTSL
jgi:hypothetical protein